MLAKGITVPGAPESSHVTTPQADEVHTDKGRRDASLPPSAALQEGLYRRQRTVARWMLVGATVAVVIWIIWRSLPILSPFLVGLGFAYVLLPLVNRLDQHMPRSLAITIVYVGGLGMVLGITAVLTPPLVDQSQQLLSSIPSTAQLQAFSNKLIDQYYNSAPETLQQPLEDMLQRVLRHFRANVTTLEQSIGALLADQLLQTLTRVPFLLSFLIIPFWLFYVLNDAAKGREWIDRVLHPRVRLDFWNTWRIIDRILGGYIRGQLILGLIIGVMVGVGLVILRFFGFPIGNYIVLLALIAGVTDLIPVLGPIIGAIPAVLLGLLISPQTGLAMLLLYFGIQQIENHLLVPRIIGESVDLHPAVLMLVLIAMGAVFGLVGVIVAAPLTAISRDVFYYIYRRLDGALPAEAAVSVMTR